MNIHVFAHQDYSHIGIIDCYESFIWTDRYNEPGEFELYTLATENLLKSLEIGDYLTIDESEHVMIVENMEIETDVENGNHVKYTGRSLESILERRVAMCMYRWHASPVQSSTTMTFHNCIGHILSEQVTSPGSNGVYNNGTPKMYPERNIENAKFLLDREYENHPEITQIDYHEQFDVGENVLSIIETMCKANDLGFKIVFNEKMDFLFSLYKGSDRSYGQDVLPYVVFKPGFENIVNSNYKKKTSDYKNVAVILIDDTNRTNFTKFKFRFVGDTTGMDRRELFVDASEVPRDSGMSDDQYYAILDEYAKNKLKEYNIKQTFEGECETSRMFVYQKDFFLGDIVQVANEYGIEAPSRVVEYVWSSNQSGTISYPTFEALEPEENNT